MSDVPNSDPQTGKGAVWGDEFVDGGDANDPVENEPGSQEPPAPQTGSSDDSK